MSIPRPTPTADQTPGPLDAPPHRRIKQLTLALTCTAAVGLTAACGSDSSASSTTPSASSSSASASTAGAPTGPPSGFPTDSSSGFPGGPGGPGGSLQTFTAVDLDTDGANATGANTAAVVAAATTFLDSLTADEKDTVEYDFSDNQSRQTWSNYPSQQVPRKGIELSALSDDSKAKALALVKTMLSAQGYSQVKAIQAADDWLNQNSASGTDSFGSDTDYYLAIYGTPSTTDAFMVQFGGHHLARNYTYKGTTASITPDFTGTEPKDFTDVTTGADVQPLKQKAGTLFNLFGSLTDDQSAQAKLSETINDILMGPGVDSGVFPASGGIKVSDLTKAQQQLVVKAIAAWVDDANPGIAASLMKTYTAQLDQTTIAYANSDTVDGENTYLRIDGPRVWIELVNTRSQSTPNVHYHGVYRDKADDYGSTNPSA